MGAKLAGLLKPVADALSVVFVPAMWVLAVAHGLLGLFALLSPNLAKGQVGMLRGNGRTRAFGIYLMLLGVLIFSQGNFAANPLIPKTAAVVLFLLGGTLLLIPAVGLIIVEWMLDKGPAFFRLIALLNILVAGLFYFAAQMRPSDDYEVEPPTSEVMEGEELSEEPAASAPVVPVTPPAAPEGVEDSTEGAE